MAIPFTNTLLNLGFFDLKNNAEVSQFLVNNLGNIHWASLLLVILGAVLEFVLRIVVAMLGDYWYRQYTIEKIKEIKLTSDNVAESFRKHGGVNLFMFLLGLMVLNYLPRIIALFI
jgi:hypothetical protein